MAESKPDYAARLSDAIEFFRKTPDAKYAPVARQFEVSPETLRRRVNGGRPAKGKPATHSKLSKAEEEALCEYVDRLNKSQLPISKKSITDAANTILEERSSKLNTQPHTVGIHWTTRFLRRYNISVPCLYVNDKKRKAAENGETVSLSPQVVIGDLDHRPRTPEKEPGSLPADTSLWLRDVHRISNFVIDSLKQLGAADDVVQTAKNLRDSFACREALFVQASARLEAEQRQETQSLSDGRASRRRFQLGRVLSIEDAPHVRMHELDNDAAESRAERARKRARRLDEKCSQQEQNEACWAAREQENADG